MPPPELTYLVCATPRSGSTLLCHTLASTGVAGRPEEFFEARRESGIPRRPREYFDDAPFLDVSGVPDVDPPAPGYSDVRRVQDWREHLAGAVRHGTTPNGVFGAKVMWMHLDDLAAFAGSRPDAVLEELFPGTRYVWVRRRDVIRQAVSLWKAMQTQAWRSGDHGGRPAETQYDFAVLDHLVGRLRREDAAWAQHFAERRLAPLTLDYDDIAGDVCGATRAVLSHLGLDPAGAAGVEPLLERQADETSIDWAARYASEAATMEGAA
jgi:LPS sulfotransferase NodH